MIRVLKTAPAGFSITKEQVKSLGFINDDSRDTDIEFLIPGAISWAEDYTGKVFVNQVWEIFYNLPEFMNVMNLDTLNVNSIVAVNTFDTDNVATLIPATDYRLFNDRIIFNEDQVFTANTLRQQGSVVIEVNAGFGADSTDQEKDIQSALAELVSYWVETNGMVSSKDTYSNIPFGLESKLQKHVKKLQWL